MGSITTLGLASIYRSQAAHILLALDFLYKQQKYNPAIKTGYILTNASIATNDKQLNMR